MFISPGNSAQIVFQLLITIFAIFVLNTWVPYVEANDNLLAITAQVVICGMCFVIILIKLEATNSEYNLDALNDLLVVLFFAVPTLVVFQFFGGVNFVCRFVRPKDVVDDVKSEDGAPRHSSLKKNGFSGENPVFSTEFADLSPASPPRRLSSFLNMQHESSEDILRHLESFDTSSAITVPHALEILESFKKQAHRARLDCETRLEQGQTRLEYQLNEFATEKLKREALEARNQELELELVNAHNVERRRASVLERESEATMGHLRIDRRRPSVMEVREGMVDGA